MHPPTSEDIVHPPTTPLVNFKQTPVHQQQIQNPTQRPLTLPDLPSPKADPKTPDFNKVSHSQANKVVLTSLTSYMFCSFFTKTLGIRPVSLVPRWGA